MAQYLSPGVYVEEKSSGAKPIEGVGTSTGAFVGIAEKGPMGEAKQIANWTQFVNTFGAYIADGYLAYAVNQFFAEGGTRCFVVRTCHYTNITDASTNTSVSSTATLLDSGGDTSIEVMASSDGTWSNFVEDQEPPLEPTVGINNEVKAATEQAVGFQLLVNYKGKPEEIFDNLTIDNVEKEIEKSDYIRVETDTGSGNIPAVIVSVPLAGGNDGLTSIDTTIDFVGDESSRTGLHAFDIVDDISIVAMPDSLGDRGAIIGGLSYCENRRDCFFVADSPM